MDSIRSLCIVDDAADYRFLLQQLFRFHFPGYPVHFFTDGEAFLQELPRIRRLPDLIILDRHMPRLDGHQTLVQLKQHPAYRIIPVVMMSYNASAEEIMGCYEAGANSFLHKPTDFESLRQTMTIVCDYWLKFNQEPVSALRTGAAFTPGTI